MAEPAVLEGLRFGVRRRYATLGVWVRHNRGLKPTATGIAPLRGAEGMANFHEFSRAFDK